MIFEVNFVTYRGLYRTVKTEKLNVPTKDGRRCILSNHMPIVLPLTVGVVNTAVDRNEEYYAITDGMLMFENNQATVLADSIIDVRDIETDKAQHKLEEAQLKLERADNENDIMMAKMSITKALNKLNAKNKYGRL